MKKIDKNIWTEALKQYKSWNEIKLKESIRNAGKKSIEKRWYEYLSIMEFGLLIKPHPSKQEEKYKIKMLNDYYKKMQRFEKYR